MYSINTLRPRQNGRRFPDDTSKRIFLNENVRISIKISLKFVPKSPINNIPSLVQIMAWRRSGDKPLSESMMVSLPTHICVTRPQWVKKEPVMWNFYITLFLNRKKLSERSRVLKKWDAMALIEKTYCDYDLRASHSNQNQNQITLLLYETSNTLQLQNALHMEHNTELRFIQHSSTKR